MNEIKHGDSLEVLEQLEPNSVHAVITDPPYGLAFMGRDWDDFEPKEYQEWCQEWAEKAKQVLKPGGHLLAFSGNRTHHRLFTGVEDAGFEIRDTLTWHYGSGFPKASDISKTIDKRADAEREQVEVDLPDHLDGGAYQDGSGDKSESDATSYYTGTNATKSIPATDAAKTWDGWKTGLKPATEFIVMARKPYDGATVDSVLENGTAALNIEACRVGGDVDTTRPDGPNNPEIYGPQTNDNRGSEHGGRYPANVIFDEVAAGALDRKVGESESTSGRTGSAGFGANDNVYGDNGGEISNDRGFDDKGGPSRYFYTSKASKAERTENGSIDNSHPTVKPIDLMEWLIKLVTKEEQIVLDPFAGSGTTCKAAKGLNRQFIGIEKQAKWADIARVRCGLTPDDPSVVRDDDGQEGLEAYSD